MFSPLSLSLCVVIYCRICSHRFGEEKKKPPAPSPPSPLPSKAPEQLVGFIALPRHWLRSLHEGRLIILIRKREDPACAFVLCPLRVSWRQQHAVNRQHLGAGSSDGGSTEQACGGHATTPCPCQPLPCAQDPPGRLLPPQTRPWEEQACPILPRDLLGNAGQVEAVTTAEMVFHSKAPSITTLGLH